MTDSSQEAASDASKDVPVGTEQQNADSGEAPNDDQVPVATATATAKDVPGEWCKIFCSKESNEAGQEYYFSNLQSGESKWEEPDAEYWLWDHGTGTYHVSGLQKPTSKETLAKEKQVRENEKDPLPYDDKDPANGWQGYNPKVHGTYDKNAPYTAYHNFLEWEKASKENPQAAAAQAQGGFQTYESVANFNSHTGRFQAGDQTADRYSADNKAGRQMNAFFDVDTAANSHDGRSLKEERRNTKLSKKEIQEMNQKRKDKKQAKRMAFLKS